MAKMEKDCGGLKIPKPLPAPKKTSTPKPAKPAGGKKK